MLSVLEHQTLYIFSCVVSILYFTVLKSYIIVMKIIMGKIAQTKMRVSNACSTLGINIIFLETGVLCQPLMFFVHLMLFVLISLHDQL